MAEKKQNQWTKLSWRSFPVRQQPLWPDTRASEDTLKKLSQLPTLVFTGESRSLKQALAEVLKGKAFVLQAGARKVYSLDVGYGQLARK